MEENMISCKKICHKYISEGIGDDYQKWYNGDDIYYQGKKDMKNWGLDAARIFIQSATGTGKTSFILGKLLPFAFENKRDILYLTNRTALKEQISSELERMGYCRVPTEVAQSPWNIFYDTVDGYRRYIIIGNYQSDFNFLNSCNFYYVIFDEAHFFFEDANFNTYTNYSLDNILYRFRRSVLIFMSATMQSVITEFGPKLIDLGPNLEFWALYRPNQTIYINTFFPQNYNPLFYEESEDLIPVIKQSDTNEKWLIFVSSLQNGKELKKLIREQTDRKVAFLWAKSKNTQNWKRLVEESYFEQDVLIATKVLDNGVNIVDKNVKHIVLPVCLETEFMQMLGRIRIQNDDAINVYAKIPSSRGINTRKNLLEKQLYILKRSLPTAPPQFAGSIINQLFNKENINFIRSILYVDCNGYIHGNWYAFPKISNEYGFYLDLLKNCNIPFYYEKQILGWLQKAEGTRPETIYLKGVYDIYGWCAYCLQEPIPPEDQERIYKAFQYFYKSYVNEKFAQCEDMRTRTLGIKKGKTQRKATINRSLALLDFPLKMVKEQKDWILCVVNEQNQATDEKSAEEPDSAN